jgi:Mce-associated membrane protein
MADDAAAPAEQPVADSRVRDFQGAPVAGAVAAHVKNPIAVGRAAPVAGLTGVVVLAGVFGWLGFRTQQAQYAVAQRNLFVEVAQQSAASLTTFDYEHADADVQRILDSATGAFYNNFSHRSGPVADAVKQARSKSVGTVAEAALESQTGDVGHVLVAVAVRSANPQQAAQEPQIWRMRITIQKVGDQGKISDVAFVS